MCITPVEVTASQLIASGHVPSAVVKSLVYPGAMVNGLILKMKIPAWDSILNIYNLTNASESSPTIELQRLEVGWLSIQIFNVNEWLNAILSFTEHVSSFGRFLQEATLW